MLKRFITSVDKKSPKEALSKKAIIIIASCVAIIGVSLVILSEMFKSNSGDITTFIVVGVCFAIVLLIFFYRLFYLKLFFSYL